jgi:glucose-6-phosphate 1-dehydrogenase
MPGNRSVPAQQVTESPSRASPADPCAMVIFGATGDLTKRLVIPALYNLARTKVLPEKFALIGVSRSVGTVEDWRNHLYYTLKSFVGNTATEFDVDRIDEVVWNQLADRMSCVEGDLTKPKLYEKLRVALGDAERLHGTAGNAIFYLAIADRLFGTVADQLGKAKLADESEYQNRERKFLSPDPQFLDLPTMPARSLLSVPHAGG